MKEIAILFLRLGTIAFGGPAAHIAMFRDEVVERRKWLGDQQFLDLLGATNLIPGPNSTEMAIHLGYLRGGLPGLILAGVSFILPAMIIVMGLAWAYVRFGSLPEIGWLLYGVKPVVIAIILRALWMLGKRAVKDILTGLIGVAALIAYLFGMNPLLAMLAGGLIVMLIHNTGKIRTSVNGAFLMPLSTWPAIFAQASPIRLDTLFFTFLKIGSVLYGSGYVLLAFLRSDLIERLGWLTDQQLIDAVAIGQVTPGPVFTTATFIGYVLAGMPGALLATLGIFLPSFIFVAISNPIIPRIRNSAWASALLDGVNVAALGLMAAVTGQLAWASINDFLTALIFLISAILTLRYRVGTTWLILGGAVIGLAKSFIS